MAKVQYKLHIASGLNLLWYGSMEWNVEENFTVLVWNGIWNGRFLVWNGNGMEENCQYGIWKNCLPFHSISCPAPSRKNVSDWFQSKCLDKMANSNVETFSSFYEHENFSFSTQEQFYSRMCLVMVAQANVLKLFRTHLNGFVLQSRDVRIDQHQNQ